MPIRPVKEMVTQANNEVEVIAASRAVEEHGSEGVLFVDVRETTERAAQGAVQGAVHVPRGFLEFMADPESAMYEEKLSDSDRLILYCGTGGRSALAAKTLKDMGYANIAHIDGGFAKWQEQGGPAESIE